MKYLRVRNWDEFQQYKDRDPKWIKFHRDILDDYEIEMLPESTQLHLFKIWLLAAKLDNKIPADARWIGRRIGASSKVDIERLVTDGFLAVYEPVQDRTETYLETEEETEEERETEEEKEGARGRAGLKCPDSVSEETWEAFVQHRREKGKRITPTAYGRLVAKLDGMAAQGHDVNAAINETIANGWTGVFEPKAGGKRNKRASVEAHNEELMRRYASGE